MKKNLFPAIRLTLVCVFVFMVLYPLLIWVAAKFAPNSGNGETITVNGKTVGYKLIGQKFSDDRYFQSRPSAVDYNAAGSGGSNKGPSNPDYLKTVQNRLDTFLVHNPGISKQQIPSELVTASGSGLDPDLSVQGSYIQAARIAKTRHIAEDKIKELVTNQTEKPLLGILGTEKINVLKLNLALDKLKQTKR